MPLKRYDDEKLNLIIKLFMDHPGGLGKRETKRLLGLITGNTIDEKMDFLIKREFMRVEPEMRIGVGVRGRGIFSQSHIFCT